MDRRDKHFRENYAQRLGVSIMNWAAETWKLQKSFPTVINNIKQQLRMRIQEQILYVE